VREPSAKYLVREAFKTTVAEPVPSEWDVRKLGEIAEIRGGIAKNSNHAVADPVTVAYLRVANVQDGYLDLTELSTIDISKQELKRYLVLPGDVLMNEGGDLDKLGRGSVWTGLVSPCVHQNHVFVVRCSPALMPAYLDLWTNAQVARKFFMLAGKQTTNLASISKTSLAQLPVALPSLDEQRAISATLGDVDALLVGLDRLIAKKRDLKQAAMQQLLTGQTRLPGFQGEWNTRLLPELADIRSGGTPSTSDPASWDGDIAWCTPTDITALAGQKYLSGTTRRITAHGLKQSSAEVIPAGSIVMTSRATIGECAINAIPMTTNQGFKNFVPYECTDAEFLYYLLLTQKSGFVSLCGGSTFLEIGKTQLRSYAVRLPAEKSEQNAIATALSDMDAELTALEARRNKTRALKQGMMQELLTGRTRLV
jgi:type I restriction enzyme, S subunit